MTGPETTLRAVRGAISVTADTAAAIDAATRELLGAIVERNALATDDLVSIIFTLTPDLAAEFPAASARAMGLGSVPLLCAQEIPKPGAMGRVLRVLVHCQMPADRPRRHPYLGDARTLRMDLPE